MISNNLIKKRASCKLLLNATIASTMMFTPFSWVSAGTTVQYLKITGINGSSVDAKHPKWSEIDSFSFNLAPTPSSPKDCITVVVQKQLDEASPKLSLYAINGNRTIASTIDVVSTSPERPILLRVTLHDMAITQNDFNSTDTGTVEQLTLKPTSMTLVFNKQNIDGTLTPVKSEITCPAI